MKMNKLFQLIVVILSFSNLIAQNKSNLKLRIYVDNSQVKYKQEANFKAYLINNNKTTIV